MQSSPGGSAYALSPAMTRVRLTYLLLALGTIALGLLVHLRGSEVLSSTVRDVLGDALWAMMIYWWIGFIMPNAARSQRSAVALTICAVVEFGQLLSVPWLNAVRSTSLGHLVLGSDFDARDLVAYAAGIGLAALKDVALERLRNEGTANRLGAAD